MGLKDLIVRLRIEEDNQMSDIKTGEVKWRLKQNWVSQIRTIARKKCQEAGQSVPQEEQQPNRNVDTDAIDPTFLEALPEDLRAEVLSSRQNQVAQPSSERSQTDGEIDPEFLAALPPDIREEVLAQQRAQRLQQSQELEGQPVEMDAVSIIATFPSEIREEVGTV